MYCTILSFYSGCSFLNKYKCYIKLWKMGLSIGIESWWCSSKSVFGPSSLFYYVKILSGEHSSGYIVSLSNDVLNFPRATQARFLLLIDAATRFKNWFDLLLFVCNCAWIIKFNIVSHNRSRTEHCVSYFKPEKCVKWNLLNTREGSATFNQRGCLTIILCEFLQFPVHVNRAPNMYKNISVLSVLSRSWNIRNITN